MLSLRISSDAPDISGGVAVQINLKHVDSSGTETQIGTEVSDTIHPNSTPELLSAKYNIPLTTFKVGEKLRLIITNTDPTGGKTLTVGHDPKNRLTLATGLTLASNSLINIPLRL